MKLYFTTAVFWKNHAFLKQLNSCLRTICAENSINFIDLESRFLNKSEYFYDDVHFLESGSREYASLIANVLVPERQSQSSKIKKVSLYTESKKINKSFHERKLINIKGVSKAILTVDYQKAPQLSRNILISIRLPDDSVVVSNYLKSLNPNIGWFRYLPKYEAEQLEVSYELPLPTGDSEYIDVALMFWRGDETVLINKADIYLIY